MGITRIRKVSLLLAGTMLIFACAGSSPGGRPTPIPTSSTPTPRPAVTPRSTAQPGPTTAPVPTLTLAGPTGETEQGRVSEVIDGDTIRVTIEGQDFRVRYIGMDAPEFGRNGQPAEDLAAESLAANKELVRGERVTLEKDVSETDEFGRLLRHVWIGTDGTWQLVNLELVRLGYAHAGTYPPDVKYTDLLLTAEREARDADAGLWGEGLSGINPIAQPVPTATPIPQPERTQKPRAPQPPARDCDPSYPTLCLPSSPDLDCGEIDARRFPVTGRDPHGFDGDGDGVGCES